MNTFKAVVIAVVISGSVFIAGSIFAAKVNIAGPTDPETMYPQAKVKPVAPETTVKAPKAETAEVTETRMETGEARALTVEERLTILEEKVRVLEAKK